MTFDNFSLRPISKEDSRNYFSLIDSNRDRILKYFPKITNANKDIQSTISYIANRILSAEKKEFITLVISDDITKKIIGTILIKNIDWNIPKCELGFFIDQNYEGKGIITKSTSLVIENCFQAMKMNKIFIRAAEDNISSRRVAEKNGFIIEGVLRSDFKTFEGNLIDMIYYGLLRPAS